jgi:hypothetical protein
MFENQKSLEKLERSVADGEEEASMESLIERESDLALLKDGLWSQEEVFKFISYLIYNR